MAACEAGDRALGLRTGSKCPSSAWRRALRLVGLESTRLQTPTVTVRAHYLIRRISASSAAMSAA